MSDHARLGPIDIDPMPSGKPASGAGGPNARRAESAGRAPQPSAAAAQGSNGALQSVGASLGYG